MTEEKKTISQKEVVFDKKKKTNSFTPTINFSVAKVEMNELLKRGVHFGHNKSRKDPRMNKFIFGTERSINIIDLQQTKKRLEDALEFIKQLRKDGKQILFVGTKKQAKALVKLTAESCEMPFVAERWLGGTFTNFKVLKKRAQYLKDSQEKMASGGFDKYTKLEKLKKEEELEKLERKMGGIKNMPELPGAVFIVDIKADEIAVKEALSAKIPIIALADTNVNPEVANYPIPANDDAISSIKLMLEYIGGAVINK